jgi:hypothetical protein
MNKPLLDLSRKELCECCNALATTYDVEGVPLCDECWEDLRIETAIIEGGVEGADY